MLINWYPQTKKDEAGEDTQAEETAPPSVPKLEIGDALPELTLKNEKDEDVQVSTLAAERGVILFLVPKADTRTLLVPSYHD